MQTVTYGSGPLDEGGVDTPEPPAHSPPLPPAQQAKYATFFKRFLAYAFDNLLVAVATIIIAAVSTGMVGVEVEHIEEGFLLMWLILGLNSALFVGYFTITTGRLGATVGKYLMGIKVERYGGGDIGYLRALFRSLGYFVSGLFLYIGFLFALFSKHNQTFHDLIAGTVVLEKK